MKCEFFKIFIMLKSLLEIICPVLIVLFRGIQAQHIQNTLDMNIGAETVKTTLML